MLKRSGAVLLILTAWLGLATIAAAENDNGRRRMSPSAVTAGMGPQDSTPHANRTDDGRLDQTETVSPVSTPDAGNESPPADRSDPATSTDAPPPLPGPAVPMRPHREAGPRGRTDGLPPAGAGGLNSTSTHRERIHESMPTLFPDSGTRSGPGPQGPPEPVVGIEPEFVKALTPITSGHNDSNPIWSPSGELIAFERSIGDKREIIISRASGEEIQKIYYRSNSDDEEMSFYLPGVVDDVSYNSGITWSPDEKSLVFMSNGGSGNYDLYLLSALGQQEAIRLTDNEEKDSHPHWSPTGPQLVFVSGRTGSADIYLMDLRARQVTRLTMGAKTYLYPRWSPDGRKVAMIYGSNENHDIYVINDIQRPSQSMQALTTWRFDDLRPGWSPDGTQIAFYTNYNRYGDPKIWSLVVVAADGSDATEGEGLAAKVVATNVIPDIERGPAWLMDSRRIVYVKNDEYAYNPIFIADVVEGTNRPLKTDTKMNHDVICSAAGLLAFRAQTEQWDHIYIAKLKP